MGVNIFRDGLLGNGIQLRLQTLDSLKAALVGGISLVVQGVRRIVRVSLFQA